MRFAVIAQIVFIVVAALGVYGFVATARDGQARNACSALCALRPHYSARNRIAPDFELPSLTGGKVRLSSLRGKSVILNFWTKTCRPCLEEMPSIASLGKALREHPSVLLVTVSTDESMADAKDTLKSVLGGDPPFMVLLDPEAEIVSGKYGTKLFPETWFIDPEGVIRARFDEAKDWATPLAIDLAESFHSPFACPVEFLHGKLQSDATHACPELGT